MQLGTRGQCHVLGDSVNAATGPQKDLDRAIAPDRQSAMKAPLAELAEGWRDDAEVLRRCGHERTPTLCEAHAAELEEAWRAYLMEPLSIREAALESGYSESRLYSLVEGGTVENAGKPGGPRIRRSDLPRKVRMHSQHCPVVDRVAIVDAALSEMRKGR